MTVRGYTTLAPYHDMFVEEMQNDTAGVQNDMVRGTEPYCRRAERHGKGYRTILQACRTTW
jgi:hypothetical protein